MSKRALTCDCGQEMMVPESAIGRRGLCPGCGTAIAITEENTRPWESTPPAPASPGKGGGLLALRQRHKAAVNNASREHSWRQFAEAVDLYNTRRYAEALTVLNGLEDAFPGNPHVAAAREQCLEALEEGLSDTREYDGRLVQGDFLNADLVHSVILDKMLRGSSEAVQLQAAELAARLLGMHPAAEGQGALESARGAQESLPAPMIMPGDDEAQQAPESRRGADAESRHHPRANGTTGSGAKPTGRRKRKRRKKQRPK